LFDPASEFGNHINLPADFDEVDELAAPFGPLPPCPKSSPSNSMKKIPEEDESCSSSSANLSSIPKTEVEVFEFREVEASPAKPSKEACAQTNLSDGDPVPPSNPNQLPRHLRRPIRQLSEQPIRYLVARPVINPQLPTAWSRIWRWMTRMRMNSSFPRRRAQCAIALRMCTTGNLLS